MLVAAVGISTTRPDAIMVGVPMLVMRIVGIIPALVFTVVVAIAFIALVFFLAFVLAIVVALVAILRRRGQRESSCQARKTIPAKNLRMSVLSQSAKPAFVFPSLA